mgnify:CR=1 FL=1
MIRRNLFPLGQCRRPRIRGKCRAGPNTLLWSRYRMAAAKEFQRDYRMSVEDQAKFMLRELDRKSREQVLILPRKRSLKIIL